MQASVAGTVCPASTRVNALGHLEVAGCDVVELASRFGTPLLIYDVGGLRDRCREYLAAFGSSYDDVTVVYAGKSFLCKAMCQIIADEDLGLDVSSGGELWMARDARFPARDIVFHGNNKSTAELTLALEVGVGRIVVDSFHELALLERLAAERDVRQTILLRLAPGVAAHTHHALQTGHERSKFGFPLRDAGAAARAALDAPHLDLAGVHCHIGSQIFELAAYAEAVEVLSAELAEWRERFAFDCREVNVGGGLAIDYLQGDGAPSVEDLAAVVAGALKVTCARHGLPLPRLVVEPGRSISGRAGLTAYTVGSVKDVPGSVRYVAVDGGMSDNPRPMLYGARYEALVANRAAQAPTQDVAVVGKHCESGDVLVADARLAEVAPGDILVTPATGAFCYSLASNYNGQPRPAIVFVDQGSPHLVVRRETWADVDRLHLPWRDR